MSLPSKPAQGKNPRTTTIVLTAVLIVITAILWITYFVTGSEWNTPSIHWLPLAILATISSLVIFSLRITWANSKKQSSFNLWIYGVTIIGGSIAFLFPLAIADFIGKDSEGSALRQMIIYATGGLLGAITLSETRRKNDLERFKFDKQNDQFTEQLNAQKENLKTELEAQRENLKTQLDAQKENLKTELEAQRENLKTQLDAQLESQKGQIDSQNEKDIRDHIRQVHAERRSRYTKAVEQITDDKATVRLGGIYTLVGLVDEWLTDTTLDEKSRQKEGQVIVNNLCSYIRSPFPLAEKIEEYEAHKELENLQKSEPEKLTAEESSRLQVLLKRFKDSDEYENSIDITAAYAKFHEEQDVRRTIFVEMSKRSSTFIKNEKGDIVPSPSTWSVFEFDFSRAPIFYPLNELTIEKGNFSSAKFHTKAEFSRVTFTCNANFSGTNFTHNADFIDVTFIDNADFSGAVFIGEAKFIGATPFINAKDFSRVTFSGNADFNNAEFHSKANFTGADFAHEANFNNATFTGDVSFRDVIFTGEAKFGGATFTSNANFVEATFKSSVGFYKATFMNFEPTFIVSCLHAQFSAAMNPRDYNFSVTTRSEPVNRGTATLLGKTFEIPLGTILFDPDSNDISEPAKPIDKSDIQGETPSK